MTPEFTAHPALIELSGPVALDLSRADVWDLILTWHSTPVERVRIAGSGPGSAGLSHAVLGPRRERQMQREWLVESLRARLGMESSAPPALGISVVVCTHRRPQMIAALIDAIGWLDPRPSELVVVDNDPGPDDCRSVVEAAGGRYVLEPRRGLNRARAAGFAAASGDVVAFIDDDCLPPPGWLASCPELFANELVAAVTGPAYAAEFATEAQFAFEQSGGFDRGLSRRLIDWTTTRPVGATSAGAGANMAFRRSALTELGGELFPPELDAGTATRSGGDFYLLYRVLAAGHRIVYSPASWVLHRHRLDDAALTDAIQGYGVGLASTLWKLLREEGELSAPVAWSWLVRQLAETTARRTGGYADEAAMRIAVDYFRGGLRGIGALRQAQAEAAAATNGAVPSPTLARADPPTDVNANDNRPAPSSRSPATWPSLSIVIPTRERPEQLARCLAALAADRNPEHDVEIIVVDDDPRSSASALPNATRVLHGGGRGAAAARNAGAAAARGDVLLFLDDDLVAQPGLLAAHAGAHSEVRGTVVIGHSAPRPRNRGLAAQLASAWWEDYLYGLRDARPTFNTVLSGNVSMPRALFERVGPYDEAFGGRGREDWEWGVRALRAGAHVVFEPNARVEHEFTMTTARSLAMAFHEGGNDALLLERYPDLASALPERPGLRRRRDRSPADAIAFLILRNARVRAAVVPVLDALERLKLRMAWSHLFGLAADAAFESGIRRAGRPRVRVLPVELLDDTPIPAPAEVAPLIELRIDGEPAGLVRPPGERWHPEIAEAIVAALDDAAWHRLTASGRTPAAPNPHRDDASVSDVAVITGVPASGLDAAIRATDAELVVVAPGTVRPTRDQVDKVASCVKGERVAAVLAASDPGPRASGLTLHSRITNPARLRPIAPPVRLIALRRSDYEELGGFDGRFAAFGAQALVFDYVDRLLDAGLVAGRLQLPGLGPQWTLTDAWQIGRVRGALARLRPVTKVPLPLVAVAMIVRVITTPAGDRGRQVVRAIAMGLGRFEARRLQSAVQR
jgi:glycosyltransferase involved in cell wall biosynthesis